jgi:diguanylate cyclase (GGDEF)-like protein
MKTPTILLVENETVLGVLTKLELEDLGYSVLDVVANGADAVAKTLEATPDLVLMDIELDGKMDGITAANKIRKDSSTPVIFVSGRSDDETLQQCLASKPYGYLRKPFTREDLGRSIETALQEFSLNKEIEEKTPTGIHDSLTGLPNRTLFLEVIQQRLDLGQANPNSHFAILYLDIDRFGRLNDNLGRAKADLVLQLFAARLESNKRKKSCVARTGADEFALLISGCKSDQDALDYAAGIQSLVLEPFWVGSDDVYISVSTGVVKTDESYKFAHEVLRDAEIALRQAKKKSVGTIALFNRDLQSDAARRFKVENDLRRALERKELMVYYQPIVDLGTHRITGFEALLRWRHPVEGLLEATEIVSIAEESGLILPIEQWVLEEACMQLAEWQKSFDPALSIHVNFSVMHLFQRNLINEIQRILNETGIDASSLKVEITENFVMKNSPSVLMTLSDLQALGVALQIDDFGTGYSSLSYLHQFPVDALKIDRSFIERAGTDSAANDIINMIVQLSRRLNLEVIAEGVETSQQLRIVQRAGCDLAQGFYFSVPVDSSEATRLLEHFHLTDPKQSFAA